MNTTQHTITPQFIYDPFDSQKITHVIYPVEIFDLNHKSAAEVLEKTKKMIEEFHWRNVPASLSEGSSIVVSSYCLKE